MSGHGNPYQLLLEVGVTLKYEDRTAALLKRLEKGRRRPLPLVNQDVPTLHDFTFEENVIADCQTFQRNEQVWHAEMEARRKRLGSKKQSHYSTANPGSAANISVSMQSMIESEQDSGNVESTAELTHDESSTTASGSGNSSANKGRAMPGAETASPTGQPTLASRLTSPKVEIDLTEFEHSLPPPDPFDVPKTLHDDLQELSTALQGPKAGPARVQSTQAQHHPIPRPHTQASWAPQAYPPLPGQVNNVNNRYSSIYPPTQHQYNSLPGPPSSSARTSPLPNRHNQSIMPYPPVRLPSAEEDMERRSQSFSYTRPEVRKPHRPPPPPPPPASSVYPPYTTSPTNRHSVIGHNRSGSGNSQLSNNLVTSPPTTQPSHVYPPPSNPFDDQPQLTPPPPKPAPMNESADDKLAAMGFSDRAVTIGKAIYGDRIKELVEFATFHDERMTKGHITREDVDVAWNLFGIGNSTSSSSSTPLERKKQFLDYVNRFVRLREMGFENHIIHDGLMTNHSNLSKTLEYCLKHGHIGNKNVR